MEWVGWLTGIAAVVVAVIFGLRRHKQQRNLAARRATLDLVMNEAHDATRLALRLKFESQMMNWKSGGNGLDDLSQDVRLDVVAYLNRFELVGVAIKHKSIDEEMYKAWSCSRYVRTWEAAREIVEETRKYRQRTDLYCEFEALAEKWARDAL